MPLAAVRIAVAVGKENTSKCINCTCFKSQSDSMRNSSDADVRILCLEEETKYEEEENIMDFVFGAEIDKHE